MRKARENDFLECCVREVVFVDCDQNSALVFKLEGLRKEQEIFKFVKNYFGFEISVNEEHLLPFAWSSCAVFLYSMGKIVYYPQFFPFEARHRDNLYYQCTAHHLELNKISLQNHPDLDKMNLVVIGETPKGYKPSSKKKSIVDAAHNAISERIRSFVVSEFTHGQPDPSRDIDMLCSVLNIERPVNV